MFFREKFFGSLFLGLRYYRVFQTIFSIQPVFRSVCNADDNHVS